MAANSNLNLVSLDMPTLESDFKTFMQSQGIFKDYNFEGSNISALIRLLGYNTFKNSFFLNMTMSEGFLDSAQQRSSVISKAKELNYVPRSARSAKTSLNFSFNGLSPSYIIPKGATFSAIVRNKGLTFSVPDTVLVTSSNGFFQVSTDVYEGPFVADQYVINYGTSKQRFLLSNPDADTSSLTVKVFQDGDITGTLYSETSTLLDITETSKVYFLQASEIGNYEVIFGDGVAGYRPPDGSTVVLDYRISKGVGGNGARQFNMNSAIGTDISNVSTIVATSDSDGGMDAEDIESIRYYAPRHFQIQERAIAPDDYVTLLKSAFPEIRTASAVGGEDLIPPQYGRVIIAVDITDVDGIPDSKIDQYTSYLSTRSSTTTKPVFVEPLYTYVSVDTKITYNLNVTTLTPNNISVLAFNEINDYANNTINDFGTTLRYSKMISGIDDAHPSIIGNETSLTIYKKIVPNVGSDNDITISFNIPLYNGYPVANTAFPSSERRCIRSDNYLSSSGLSYLTDDGAGVIWVAVDQGSQTRLIRQTGTVNYTSGTINLSKWNVQNYTGTEIKLFALPAELDIVSPKDTILQIEPGQISLNVIIARE